MIHTKRATQLSRVFMLSALAILLLLFFRGRATAQPFFPTAAPTGAPTMAATALVDNGTVDLGIISVPAGLTYGLDVDGLEGWVDNNDLAYDNIQWRWEGMPEGMVITDRSTPVPWNRTFYLTPSATTAIDTYELTLYATNNTAQWKKTLRVNVTACHETFQPGTYTLNATDNPAKTYFSDGGPDAWRAGVGDQRWFTFCASPQERQLNITLLSATGTAEQSRYSIIPDTIDFYRSASWPLQPLSSQALTFSTAFYMPEVAPGKVITWTVQPGAYIVFFVSTTWGMVVEPSVTVTYSVSLS